MDAMIKTISWRNIQDLAEALTGTPFAAHKQIPKTGGGWCIYVNQDYLNAKKGAVLYYNVYGGFITRARKGFSDKSPIIFDKSISLSAFTIGRRRNLNAA